MEDNITKLLGLKDVIVKNVEDKENCIYISIELLRKEHKCPRCGALTRRVHDYRIQTVKDLDAFEKKCCLLLRKRRYMCPECGKRFYEKNSFLPRYSHMTQRLVLEIIKEFQNIRTATDIAGDHNVSVTTALRCFNLINFGRPRLPQVLSIDEFKGNAGGEKFQTIITDGDRHKVLDILNNRKQSDLIKYFMSFPRKERLKVKYVIMDMSSLFYGVVQICFPKAIIVADRYHVTRQAIWAFENVRKTEQKRLSAAWRKFCKRSRTLLNKNPNSLLESEKEKVSIILSLSQRLEYAYYLKNEFLLLMHSADSTEGRKRLSKWVYTAEIAELPEFKSCTKALHNWSEEILNSFDCHYSNGFTEGCNNKTKVLKRICYGVRNFARFRNRILFCASAS